MMYRGPQNSVITVASLPSRIMVADPVNNPCDSDDRHARRWAATAMVQMTRDKADQ